MATKNVAMSKGHLERLSHVESEPRRRLPPIEGFETMPLVPIEQSVERLVGMITNVKKYALKAKEVVKRKYSPSDVLTIDEAAAICLYTMQWLKEEGDSVYRAMNHDLENKDREALKPWFPYLRLLLTGLLKLPPIRCHVFRGVNKALHENYRNPEEKALWWRFSSCTTTVEVLENKNFLGQSGERTLFDIICSEGRSIEAYSDYQNEEEVLLLPGTLFKIKEVAKMTDKLHMITLEETDTDIYLPARKLLKNRRIQAPVSEPKPPRIIPPTPKQYSSYEMGPRPAEPRRDLGKEISRCPSRGVGEFKRLRLTNAEMSQIAKRVIIDKECTRLILSNNNIRADGLVKLAKAAKESQTLIELNLARNHLTDDDVQALAEALTIDGTVEEEPSGCPCPWSSTEVSENLHSILSSKILFLGTRGGGRSFASAQSR